MRRINWLFLALLLTASCTAGPDVKLAAPFKQTPDEEQKVDRLLARWEQWNAGVKTFDCRFKRWTYDAVFGRPDVPRFVELGTLRYAAPDKWLFQVDKSEKDGKEVPIDDRRAEHWAFDGRSIIEYDHVKRQMIEHKLPANFQSKRLVDGPLTMPIYSAGLFWFGLGLSQSEPVAPAPFGAKAKDLKEQYYLRDITPAKQHDQIWLEAYPRSSRLAANHQRLQLIFSAADMSPIAMQTRAAERKGRGQVSVLRRCRKRPTNASTASSFVPQFPFGWQKIVEESPTR